MTNIDSLYNQLDQLHRDMEGISPKTSTYKRLGDECIRINERIETLKAQKREEQAIRVSNEVFNVHVKTPRGWECPRHGCRLKVRHTHTTFSEISLNANTGPKAQKSQ